MFVDQAFLSQLFINLATAGVKGEFERLLLELWASHVRVETLGGCAETVEESLPQAGRREQPECRSGPAERIEVGDSLPLQEAKRRAAGAAGPSAGRQGH
ncbi:hypothetical protein scyTo_0024219 [Scyliorhinus torazame]|uniref:Uncharacterized protein n=1 Tax=Scyliorhinus torazame TaxID=75743 RepID=A0A401QDS5_SCYTO|nr:hypothetical protein [Scyliorhinus torazame]